MFLTCGICQNLVLKDDIMAHLCMLEYGPSDGYFLLEEKTTFYPAIGNTVILPSSIDTIGESESPEYNREHVGSVFSDDCNETRITAALDEHFILQSQNTETPALLNIIHCPESELEPLTKIPKMESSFNVLLNSESKVQSLNGPFFGNPSNGQTNLSEAFLERESQDTLQNLSREEAVDVLPSICEETSKTFDASNILSDICYKNEEHLSELEDDDIYDSLGVLKPQFIYEKLKGLDLFECGKLKTETNVVWTTALERLNYKIKKHNLVEKIRKAVKGKKVSTISVLQKLHPKFKEPESEICDKPELQDDEINEIDDLKTIRDELFTDGFLGPALKLLDESPFSVYYRWAEQIYVWRVTHNYIESSVLFDVAKTAIKISSPWYNIDKPIYLYSILMKCKSKLIPAVQMISEVFDYNRLSDFFHEWLRKTTDVSTHPPAPENFVTVASHSSLQLACNVFNFESLETYNIKSYEFFKGLSTSFDTNCVILFDCKSVILQFRQKHFFSKYLQETEINFLSSCVYHLSLQETISDFLEGFDHLFSLLINKYEDENTVAAVEYFKNVTVSSSFLSEILPTILGQNIDHLDIEPLINFDLNIFLQGKTDNLMLIDLLTRVSKLRNEKVVLGYKDNSYYNDILAKYMLCFSLTFPMWTKIMPKFHVTNFKNDQMALHHLLEAYYQDIKHIMEMPSASDFLITHISFLHQMMTENRALLSQYKTNQKRNVQETGEIHAYLEEQENWRNKAMVGKEGPPSMDEEKGEGEDSIEQENNRTQLNPDGLIAVLERNFTKNTRNVSNKFDSDAHFGAVTCHSKNVTSPTNNSKVELENIITSIGQTADKSNVVFDESTSSLDQTKFESRIKLSNQTSSPKEACFNHPRPTVLNENPFTAFDPKKNENNNADKQKKVGKFLRPFPQAKQYYDKPVTTHKFKTLVIKNGKFCQPARATKDMKAIIKKKRAQIKSNDNKELELRRKEDLYYSFTCTTSFDAIFIIILNAFNNFQNYNTFCQNAAIASKESASLNFFASLLRYTQTGKISDYKKIRAELICDIGKVEKCQISCPEKIQYYFSALMGDNYSLKRILICSKCNYSSPEQKSHILQFTKGVIQTVSTEYYLDNLFKKDSKRYVCSVCKNIMSISITIQDYLVVDIEDENLEINITHLKNQIYIDNQILDVVGVIGFVYDLKKSKEYCSYYKSVGDTWYFQSFSKDSSEQKVTKNFSPKTVKTSLIMYIPRRNENIEMTFNNAIMSDKIPSSLDILNSTFSNTTDKNPCEEPLLHTTEPETQLHDTNIAAFDESLEKDESFTALSNGNGLSEIQMCQLPKVAQMLENSDFDTNNAAFDESLEKDESFTALSNGNGLSEVQMCQLPKVAQMLENSDFSNRNNSDDSFSSWDTVAFRKAIGTDKNHSSKNNGTLSTHSLNSTQQDITNNYVEREPVYLNIVNFRKEFPLILNGNKIKKTVNNIKHKDTSRFDTIAELCIHAYCNFYHFNKHCRMYQDQNSTGFLKTISDYSESKVNSIYEARWDILFNKKIDNISEDKTMFSQEGIGVYFDKLLKSNYVCPSCGECTPAEIAKFTVSLDATFDTFREKILPANLTDQAKYTCQKCNHDINIYSNFLAIDLDSKYLKYRVDKLQDILYIPPIKSYSLAGVICKPLQCKSNTPDYVAYCRHPVSGQWTSRNSMKEKGDKVDECMYVSIMFFVDDNPLSVDMQLIHNY